MSNRNNHAVLPPRFAFAGSDTSPMTRPQAASPFQEGLDWRCSAFASVSLETDVSLETPRNRAPRGGAR